MTTDKQTNTPLNRWIWLLLWNTKWNLSLEARRGWKKHHGKGTKIFVNLGYLTNPQSSKTRQDNQTKHTRQQEQRNTHRHIKTRGPKVVGQCRGLSEEKGHMFRAEEQGKGLWNCTSILAVFLLLWQNTTSKVCDRRKSWLGHMVAGS